MLQQAWTLYNQSSNKGIIHYERLHAWRWLKDLDEQAKWEEFSRRGTPEEGKVRAIRKKAPDDGGAPPPLPA